MFAAYSSLESTNIRNIVMQLLELPASCLDRAREKLYTHKALPWDLFGWTVLVLLRNPLRCFNKWPPAGLMEMHHGCTMVKTLELAGNRTNPSTLPLRASTIQHDGLGQISDMKAPHNLQVLRTILYEL